MSDGHIRSMSVLHRLLNLGFFYEGNQTANLKYIKNRTKELQSLHGYTKCRSEITEPTELHSIEQKKIKRKKKTKEVTGGKSEID